MNALAYIISGNSIGALLKWLVGVAVCVAIVHGIFKLLGVPEWFYKALYVIVGVLFLLLSIDFFFGANGT